MSGRVIAEVETPAGWTRLGSVARYEARGTVLSDTTEGRDVYAFGWFLGQGPGLWKSPNGLPAVDAVDTTGDLIRVDLHLISELQEPVTVPITSRAGTTTVRFRYQP